METRKERRRNQKEQRRAREHTLSPGSAATNSDSQFTDEAEGANALLTADYAAYEAKRIRQEHERAAQAFRERVQQENAEAQARARARARVQKAKADAEAKLLKELSDTFIIWKNDCDNALRDKASLRTIPKLTHLHCDNVSCQARMADLSEKFCKHDLFYMVGAHAHINKFTPMQVGDLIKAEQRKWHPDRFTRCGDDVKGQIQAVAEEIMKIYQGLRDPKD